MFCYKCGKEVTEKAHFCSSCGAKLDIDILRQLIIDQRKIEPRLPVIDDLLITASAEDLYHKANFYHEAGDHVNLEQICRFLVNKFPNSKEAKWARLNFPIKVDTTTNSVTLDRSSTDSVVRLILGIIGALLLFIGLFTPVAAGNTIAQNGGVIFITIIILASLSIILSFTKKFSGLWLSGFASTIVSLEIFFKNRELIEWGWVMLFFGSCFLLAAASIRKVPEFFRTITD